MADSTDTAHEKSKIVTEFLLNTYRLQPTAFDAIAAMTCGAASSEAERDPLLTGSSVELYVKPMLPFIADIDFMHYDNDVLAIPAGNPAPRNLPASFCSRVRVHEITDSPYPGFVYLVPRYILTALPNDDEYKAEVVKEQMFAYLRIKVKNGFELHGPAINGQWLPGSDIDIIYDSVPCVRCLSWPPQAADWPTRQRNYGWPDSATVDRIVSNGCDLVKVSNRLCRQYELENRYQFRLSFSRAEIILLNTCLPVQQIVYHMLRIYVKTMKLTDITENSGTKISPLSNYHIKTLMLWASEVESKAWWTEDVNLLKISAVLLHTVADWLTNARFPHHFIHECNLFESTYATEYVVVHLRSITESWLSTWYVNNYILLCAQVCPASELIDDFSTNVKLRRACSVITNWRRETAVRDLRYVFHTVESQLPGFVHGSRLPRRSYLHYMKLLAKLDWRFSIYVTAVALLHCCYIISKHGLSDELMDVLSVICGHSSNRRLSSRNRSRSSFEQAAKLMKIVASNSRSTVWLIEIELSKAYLYRALRCEDSDSDSIYCLANVYLAGLYYTTGQYQTAIDHCTLVTRSQDHSQCSSRVVRELLPKIDDNVDTAFGLAILYQYTRLTAMKRQPQPTRNVSILTLELLAAYIRWLSCTKCCKFVKDHNTSILDESQRYEKDILETKQLLTADVLLYKLFRVSFEQKCLNSKTLMYRREGPSLPVTTELNTSQLTEVLQLSAVEHMTQYRQLVTRIFDGISVVGTDFEAMYAYKRGDYQHCLHLCTHNVQTLLYSDDFHPISTRPGFIQLLDGDIVSVIALTLIVDPSCRGVAMGYVAISQLTLSLYLMTQCQLKLRHSSTQLARTLHYIKVAQRTHPLQMTHDQLTLKLAKRKTRYHLLAMYLDWCEV